MLTLIKRKPRVAIKISESKLESKDVISGFYQFQRRKSRMNKWGQWIFRAVALL